MTDEEKEIQNLLAKGALYTRKDVDKIIENTEKINEAECEKERNKKCPQCGTDSEIVTFWCGDCMFENENKAVQSERQRIKKIVEEFRYQRMGTGHGHDVPRLNMLNEDWEELLSKIDEVKE